VSRHETCPPARQVALPPAGTLNARTSACYRNRVNNTQIRGKRGTLPLFPADVKTRHVDVAARGAQHAIADAVECLPTAFKTWRFQILTANSLQLAVYGLWRATDNSEVRNQRAELPRKGSRDRGREGSSGPVAGSGSGRRHKRERRRGRGGEGKDDGMASGPSAAETS
jgi:hypothetical protein